MIADMVCQEIVFEKVNDMVGMRYGIYREENGQREVLVSPAIYSLLRGPEQPAVMAGLLVQTEQELRWVMDL